MPYSQNGATGSLSGPRILMQANGRTGLIKHLGGSSDPHFVAGYAPIRPNRVDSRN
jgi:hypothetical protein